MYGALEKLKSNQLQAEWMEKLHNTVAMFEANYKVKGSISRPGLAIEIRRFSWEKKPEAKSVTMNLCYLSLALTPRPVGAVVDYLGSHSDQSFTALGNCCFVPAGQELYNRAAMGEYQEICCLFDISFLEPYMNWNWTPLELAACFDIKNISIRNHLMHLAEEVLSPGYGSDILVDATFQALLIELSRHFRAVRANNDNTSGQLSSRNMRLISDKVRSSLEQDLNIETLANLCGVSGRHLARMFKKTTGRTLGEFISEERINQAKLLLSQSDGLVKEVAFKCGFHSQSSFSQAFRNATGRTPSQFRSGLEF